MAGENHAQDNDSGGTLRDILADLVSTQSDTSNPHSAPLSPLPQADSSWILPPYSPLPPRPPSTASRIPPSPMPRTSSASRPAQQQIAASTSQSVPPATGDANSQSAPFTTPARSIFSSGPPTASVSANTAQASLSAAGPSGTSRPLAALSATSVGSSRRNTNRLGEAPPIPAPFRRGPLHIPEKDVDDPSSAFYESPEKSTALAISRLLGAGQATPLPASRSVSYFRAPNSPNSYADASTLAGHLLQRGLVDGRHSDITIHAFGSSYRLHRLLLDRAPFFSSALSGSWAESSASEMTLHPEEVDVNITKTAFELALKRIYGCHLPADEEREAIGLFATSCWLDMTHVMDSSVDILLRQMGPSRLDLLIRLVTGNYYGKAGDRILASAKAMLCREGWEMPYEYWDNIPSEIVREVVGGDAFFVPGEWERWYLALRLLNRRLKACAIKAGLVSQSGRCLQSKPITLGFFAVRFDATYRRDQTVAGRGSADGDEAWIGLYTSPDIAPLLVLLDEGIHYVHLRFEQLQRIREQKDRFGVPVLPEKVISDSLWMSMELRQRVVNTHETEMELGLSHEAEGPDDETSLNSESESTNRKGKQPESHHRQPLYMESGSWDGNGKPRKFWIPTSDSSSIMGGTSDTYLAASSTAPGTAGGGGVGGNNSGGPWSAHMSRLSASLEPSDVQWATDFTLGGIGADGGSGGPSTRHPNNEPSANNPRYSHYPPFRFSAEFPNPRTLKEKKRVYSQTVWYAGSMWNLYIQRVMTSKNQQLGIYLHRAKDKDPSDDPLALYDATTVDDRIGHLEREMLMRHNNYRRHQSWRSSNTTIGGAEIDGDEDVVTGGSIADNTHHTASSSSLTATEAPEASSARRTGGGSGRRATVNLARAQKTSQTPASSSNANHQHPLGLPLTAAPYRPRPYQQQLSSSRRIIDSDDAPDENDNDNDDESNESNLISNSNNPRTDSPAAPDSDTDPEPSHTNNTAAAAAVRRTSKKHHHHHHHSRSSPSLSLPTLPPYTDARPTVKTYFKIYSPSRGGRMLSVYESAPDKFNFSQSWGWKSSSLGVVDEGFGYTGAGSAASGGANSGGPELGGTGKVRFMVVIGNV